MGSVLGLGRSPGGGNGNLLQYSCLGNAMDRAGWQGSTLKTKHLTPEIVLKLSICFNKSNFKVLPAAQRRHF